MRNGLRDFLGHGTGSPVVIAHEKPDAALIRGKISERRSGRARSILGGLERNHGLRDALGLNETASVTESDMSFGEHTPTSVRGCPYRISRVGQRGVARVRAESGG